MSESDQAIIDAIDLGSFKYAQSLLSLKLRTFPQQSLYWCLNCYLALCMGRVEEAVEQGRKLLEKVPSNPQTLSLLYKVFRQTGHDREANQVYEFAARKYPDNVVLESWFENAVKYLDLKAIQQATMSLQKNNKSDRNYAFWAGNSCLIYGNNSEGKQASLFHKLGLRLVEGLAPFENSQQVFVYVSLLHRLGEMGRLIDSLLQFRKSNTLDLDLHIILVDALTADNRWDQLYKYCHDIILNQKFNDFDAWKSMIYAGHKIDIGFADMISTIRAQSPCRNSLLAQIEASKVYHEPSSEYISVYYQKFKGKPCCFNDLKYYQELIDEQLLWQELERNSESTKSVSGTNSTDLNIAINSQKLKLLFHRDDDLFATDNFDIYDKFRAIAQQKEETDFYGANELVLINVINDLKQSFTSTSIIKNIIILESLIDNDRHNFNVRLWLMVLYSHINCQSQVQSSYELLKIKMIQHDTLGHFLINRGVYYTKAYMSQLVNMYRFYLTAEQEIKDNILEGFQKTAFNKLESIIKFGLRIDRSLSKYHLILNILKLSRIANDGYYNYFSNVITDVEMPLLQDTFHLYDNTDNKTLWKFGINENLETLVQPMMPQCNAEYVKLCLLKELLILKAKDKPVKLFKLFNKRINHSSYWEQLTNFEKWLFKIYTNIFKLVISDNSKDSEAIVNYLVKNLKIEKIEPFINESQSIISWEINHIVTNLLDLVKVIELLTAQGSLILLPLHIKSNLVKELKKKHINRKQMEYLNSLTSSSFSFNQNLHITENQIKMSLERITSSISNFLI